MLQQALDLFLHLDRHLAAMVAEYGRTIYAVLFAIIFLETGVVVTPILPGDSLLFACGALSATGGLDPWLLLILLSVAAVAGDSVNYTVGRFIGPRAFATESRLLNRKHLLEAHAFYERHGGKTIVIARFVPIIRTFAPFVAGIGTMAYPRFFAYNVIGGVSWVLAGLGAGYAFGNVPAVREHFSLVVLGIVAVSVLPIVLAAWKRRGQPA
ncbi:MAG TPA: DedA family protein [Candidatus Sulfotelmatobacter sp.]|jgi:membrane-associated protein|nr:DedA family protein [Candidatus Sulfotelmatobacter sp.]